VLITSLPPVNHTIVTIKKPRVPANSSFLYRGKLGVGDYFSCSNPLRGSQLSSLTLTIADSQTYQVVNNCYQVNILNQGRGRIDEYGNLWVQVLSQDTALLDTLGPFSVQRSLVLDWSYLTNVNTIAKWRHEVKFFITALTEDLVNYG
jgi:hypothetical protein